MKQIKKITPTVFIAIFTLSMIASGIPLAANSASYGTTTFFSEKDEKPSAAPPIYDVGASVSKNVEDKKKDEPSDSYSGGSLFNQIVGGISSFFGDSGVPLNSTKASLFDLQGNSDQSSSGDSDGDYSGEYIMGARGESYENMNAEEVANYNNRISKGFSFSDSASTTPKKSKLLFTNIMVPVDMTTQYVLIALVFAIAIGGAVGYYLWKKGEAADKNKYNQQND